MLSNDWVIRYDTRYFQVARQSRQAPARSTVLVREAVTGAIEIRYRGRLIRWTEIPAPPPRPSLTPTAARAATGKIRGDASARLEAQLSFSDDGFADLQTLFHHDIVGHALPRGDRALLDRGIVLHDENVLAILSGLHGL